MSTAPHISWFADLDIESDHFGRHTKQHAKLTQAKFPLIPGFVITPHAYYDFLRANDLELKIRQLLSTVSFELPDSLMQAEFHINRLFKAAKLSDDFIEKLLNFYIRLGPEVTIELHETGTHGKKHNKVSISANDKLTQQIITLWAEMFSGKALWQRHHHNNSSDHFATGAEIIVQKKIRGDKTGKVITIEPTTHARDKIFIMLETPHHGDWYILSKKNIMIVDRKIKHSSQKAKLTLEEILYIAATAKQLEEYLFFPQEISWIIDKDQLFITDIKPVTEFAKQKTQTRSKLPIARGKSLTSFIGTGTTTVVHLPADLSHLKTNTILIAPDVKASDVKKIKKVKGIITESHPHAATTVMLRHYGIPAICNVKHATKRFRNGTIVSIHGEKGEIYLGGFL